MSQENPKPSPEELLNKRRVEYADSMMNVSTLVGYISFDTQFHDKELPDFIEWNKDSFLGEGNVYVNDVRLGCYFKSQEEFIECCIHPKDSEGEDIIDKNGKQIQFFRDFDSEIDANKFPINAQEYSVIKVFIKDDVIALAGKTDADGIFSIDVYPSIELKKDILQSLIDMIQERMDKTKTELGGRIQNYKTQLENLK